MVVRAQDKQIVIKFTRLFENRVRQNRPLDHQGATYANPFVAQCRSIGLSLPMLCPQSFRVGSLSESIRSCSSESLALM